MKENEARKAVAEYCRRLYEKGFLPGKDGNISARVDPGLIIVTPTGVSKENITEDLLVCLNLSGDVVSGTTKPTSEAKMHIAAYRARPDAGAVIHAHSENIGAFVLARKAIDTRCAPFAYIHLGMIGQVPYITPGTPELHKTVEEELLKGYRALQLMGHGSIVLGADLGEAFERLDLLESFAGMLLKAQTIGGAKVMTKEELDSIIGG